MRSFSIKKIFEHKPKTVSFELFPPKTEQGLITLKSTIASLSAYRPDFFSCTYGAGGGNRDKTFDIVAHIQEAHGIAAMAHLTCVCHTRHEIKTILLHMRQRGINNILALRGDPPKDDPDWRPGPEHFKYACELVAFIRRVLGDDPTIAVAGFPEGHPLSPDRETDARHTKLKIDSGADFVITQLFFNNDDYTSYVERLRRLDVAVRIIPGVLPITDYRALLRFCSLCQATVPEEVHAIFRPIQDDPQAMLEAGIAYAVRQCRDLLQRGAPGLHFYTLNKLHPTAAILTRIRDLVDA